MASPARLRPVLLALVAVLATVLTTPGPAAQAADHKGIVNGSITCPKLHTCPGLKLLWFDEDWHYLGEKSLGKGARGYSLNLPAGTYRLQLIDQRPSYDVSKFAPTDVQVTVKANRLSERNITMKKGGAITGTAVNGKGNRLKGATVVAANRAEQSFSTQANKKGQFAIGGLPEGKYSVFTYDRARTWVGKSTWAGLVEPGHAKNIRIRLATRAGDLTVYLTTPNGLLKKKTTLTVTSNRTGQWWSKTSSTGTFAFRGLFPGGYTATFNGAGVWFGKTGAVQKADVRSNGFDTGEFHVTKRGGWVTGKVVDGGGADGQTDFAMENVRVGLYDRQGRELATDVTNATGHFKLEGQLVTQDRLTITVDPSPNGGGWMTAAPPANWCLFDSGQEKGIAITQGKETSAGRVPLPRSTDPAQPDECLN